MTFRSRPNLAAWLAALLFRKGHAQRPQRPEHEDLHQWGVFTIGTGLGNARFTNRQSVDRCRLALSDLDNCHYGR
jgi:hypothetical protein